MIKPVINIHGKDKDLDFRDLFTNFRDVEAAIKGVQIHIRAGHALCAGLLEREWQSKAKVIDSQCLLLDVAVRTALQDKADSEKAVEAFTVVATCLLLTSSRGS
ncbi:MAG TPA: hypothetical protein VE956_04040 [Nodularia sp. (in: cyanobacteria)]|nr:hypothetical protein [Nodularia sp. (in: cyanobacteria)]